MRNSEKTFQWIIGILRKHEVPFVVTGGLAAKIYGSPRDLNDIDIDIPESYFETIVADVKPYLVYGPNHFTDEHWDLQLMTLNHEGQMIDISGGETLKIHDSRTQEWRPMPSDFLNVEQREVFGIVVSVIRREDLIEYKVMLARDHEVTDIEAVRKNLTTT